MYFLVSDPVVFATAAPTKIPLGNCRGRCFHFKMSFFCLIKVGSLNTSVFSERICSLLNVLALR